MQKTINFLEKIIIPLNKIAGFIPAILLFIMMLLTSSDVIGRYFIRPITDTYEITELLLALVVFWGLGYAQIYKEHIVIDIFVKKMNERVQAILSTIINASGFIFLIILFQQTLAFADRNDGVTTGQLQLPLSTFIIISGLGLLFFILAFFLDFLKSLQKVVSKKHVS